MGRFGTQSFFRASSSLLFGKVWVPFLRIARFFVQCGLGGREDSGAYPKL